MATSSPRSDDQVEALQRDHLDPLGPEDPHQPLADDVSAQPVDPAGAFGGPFGRPALQRRQIGDGLRSAVVVTSASLSEPEHLTEAHADG